MARTLRSAVVGIALAVGAVLAYATHLGQQPVAAAIAPLAAMGAGKLGLLYAQPLDRAGRPPRGMEAIARDAAAAWPLADEPFYAVALARWFAAKSVPDPRVAALLREAIRRNPRSREARLLLIRHSVASADLREAIDQLAVLHRLGSETATQLLGGIAQAISSEQQIDELVAALRRHPELYDSFMVAFTSARKPPRLALRLTSQLPASALANPRVASAAINEMVRARAFAQAKATWSRQNPHAGRGLIHSPNFADARSTPPFNWELSADEVGVAERARGGGLTVAYYGRSPGALARQLLVLAPGTYRAVLVYQHDGGTPGAIGLTVRCADPQANVLASAPLADAKPGRRELLLPFIVPPSCRGQFISLDGLPLIDRDGQNATAWRLDVARSAAS